MGGKYDVLQEPWIPVLDKSGNRKKVSVEEALTTSNSLVEVSIANPMLEYAVYRFLDVLLMDMIRPETIEDIEDLLDRESFSKQELNVYRMLCEKEGTSFDLFDENKPFMQVKVDPAYEKKLSDASYLDCTIPTGNNAVHFDHLDRPNDLPFDEVLPKIIALQIFSVAGVQGFPSSINGAPPYFSVIKGETLYKTLCNMLVPIEELKVSFDDPKVYWRSDVQVTPKELVTRTSWLFGMLFPARRIHVVPDWDSKTVKKVYVSQGLNFNAPNNWTDPNVTYREGKDGRFPWRPDGAKAVWRNLYDLVDVSGKRAPIVLSVYQRIHRSTIADITLYGVQTNQASYVQLVRHDLRVPIKIMTDEKRIDTLKNCIVTAENTASYIRSSMVGKAVPTKISDLLISVESECEQAFYHGCEQYLWEMCDTYLASENFDMKQCIMFWNQMIRKTAIKCVNEKIDSLLLPASSLIAVYKGQRGLMKYLNDLLKEGE